MRVCCWMHWKRAMIDLNPNHLATVERILTKHVPECEVRTFGSRATWTAKDYSDLDLAVVGEGPLDRRTLGQLKEAFEESSLPMRVDVLDWYAISESFREVIERDYVVLREGMLEAAVRTEQHTTILGDVTNVVMGQSPPGNTVSSEHGLALLNGPTEFGAHHPTPAQYTTDARKFAQPGDLLFCVRGSTTGRMNWADQEYAIGRGVAAIRHRHEPALQPFVRGVIEVELPELLTQATGSTFPNVSARQLAEIPYPSLDKSEQRAIAHILGTLDDKIELNRRMNETLEEMVRVLFKSWFVDFEPVRAKMEGRWQRGESLPGLPADLYDLFPDRLVDSELGEIPEGWEVKTLGEVAELNPLEPMKRGTLAPYLDMAALPTSGSSPEKAVLREFKSGTRFRNGDTLLARITPCLENGKTAFVQSLATGKVGWGSTEFIVMRAIPPVPAEYTYLLARDDGFREHAIQSMTGTSGRQRVQVDVLAPYPLPIPPTETWNEFSVLVRPAFAQIEFNRKESLALSAQRDTLLPRLVSGEVAIEASQNLKASIESSLKYQDRGGASWLWRPGW